ncbi:hypothetical protein LCGC14_0910430 [marine sediment metagenome]|uniref:Uncharacterized protein n=1 Tax=marine sediment metagenome TaxID=412755 RepID=A0A0F9NYH0_9ZZZZ
MAEETDHPCLKGLTPKCFRQFPEYAKQLFAFRLLLLFFPSDLSRKILEFLAIFPPEPPFGVPSTPLPPWGNGAAADDGKSSPGEPEGPPGAPPEAPGAPGGPKTKEPPFIPPYPALPPWAPGRPARPSDPPPADPWFHDAFNSLDLTVWEKWLWGSATIHVEPGQAKFISTGADYCILRTAADPTIPDSWYVDFKVKIESYSDPNARFFIQFFSGSHVVKLLLNPPTIITHATGPGSDEITVSPYINQWQTFRLVYIDGYTDLLRNGSIISIDQHHQHSVSYPGRIYFSADNQITAWVDYVTLTER